MDSKESQFKWGEIQESKYTTKVKLVEEECFTYKSYEMDGVKVCLGDYILIRKSSNSDIRSCYVARVKVLYDTGARNDSCHRAVINWYCRTADLNKNLAKSISKFPKPPAEFQEVFADRRNKCVDDIDAETIFQTCKVTKVDVCLKNLPEVNSSSLNLILRWKYFDNCLEPVVNVSIIPLKNTSTMLIRDPNDEFDSDVEAETPSCFKVKSPHRYCKTPSTSRLKMTLVRTSKTRRESAKSKCSRRSQSADEKTLVSSRSEQHSSKAKRKLILDEKENFTVRSQFGRKITPNKKFIDDSSSSEEEALSVQPLGTPVKSKNKRLPKECFVKIERSPLISKNSKTGSDDFKTPIKLSKTKTVGLNTPASRSNRKLSTRRKVFESDDEISPVKRAKETAPPKTFHSRSGRKINVRLFDDGINTEKTENSDSAYSYSSSDDSDFEDKPRKRGRPRNQTGSSMKSKIQTPRQLRKAGLTPSMPKRTIQLQSTKCKLEQATEKLHCSSIPNSLPCREREFAEIFAFIEGKLATNTGGCMYISGVPGTGKTASISNVIESLQKLSENEELPPFKFLSINGMKLTEPRQAYVQIYKELCGQQVTAAHAVQLLCKHFETSRKCNSESVVLLVDELDLLWNRKQDVLYNLFNWPSTPNSNLVVVAIANTMDLPERIMKNRISSRLGLTRVTFQPYNFKQLQQILLSRLSQSDAFDPDSVQFIARKVAAFSGDARRALEICRRAAELVGTGSASASPTKKIGCVGMAEADAAIQEMFSSPKIEAIRYASLQERIFLRAVVCEFKRTGLEESTFNKIYGKHCLLCRVEGLSVLNSSEVMTICARLGSCRLLLLDGKNDILQRVRLNMSTDDVNFALNRPSSAD